MRVPLSTRLVSERLVLRAPSFKDIPYIFEASHFPGFTDGMPWEPSAQETEYIAPMERSLQAWKAGRGFSFSIDRKEDDTFVGRVSIRETDHELIWNIGFWTHPHHQGNGYMTEAVKRILDFGFTEFKAESIEADYATWNIASERVLHKSGFKFVKHIPEGFKKHGHWVEENQVRIMRSDWKRED
ncbi:MAG: GNAT family N-acetyltransferase [Bacteroidota bacterium]